MASHGLVVWQEAGVVVVDLDRSSQMLDEELEISRAALESDTGLVEGTLTVTTYWPVMKQLI
jgi:hypothetical protein